MAENPVQLEAVGIATPPLAFEQPLTERMRTFLRLDFLYSQAVYHHEMASQWGSRAAVASLLDILSISTRSDVRADVLKELERHIGLLGGFQARPGVDDARLRAVVANLVRLRTELSASGTGYLQSLKDSEFLSAIKHRSAIPGGTCEFDLPDFYFWLNRPIELRAQAFGQWLGLLRPLCDAIAELLWLTRQNGRPREELAPGGTFSINFDRDAPIQLMRIAMPAGSNLYPEISGSHYRCSVRFLQWNGLAGRATQAEGDVPFVLTCCT
jgi:cell division protein ZapD